MSKTKWVAAVVIVVVLVAAYVMWKGNTAMVPASDQPTAAAAANAPVANNNTDAMMAADAAALDAQIQVYTANVKGLDQTLTVGTVTAAATQTQDILALATKLGVKIQVRIAGAGAAQGSLQALFADMTRNISNASSQAAAAAKNVAKTPNGTALAQSKTQLNAAQAYVVTVRSDIQKLLAGIAQR
ncbi:MAG: hypothetical protein NT019_02265 [Candidatus Adlerbacteria bacterium]|nr:hypothetical protein [Candidatus Adlerbacteria bacterium]